MNHHQGKRDQRVKKWVGIDQDSLERGEGEKGNHIFLPLLASLGLHQTIF